ncbi:hypothetical protein ACQ4PT_069214 [Festuca glaucescens]
MGTSRGIHARHQDALRRRGRRDHHQRVPVQQCRHAQPQGRLVTAMRGGLAMPFPDASVNSANTTIEATCHAPRLQDINGEVIRVLKLGGRYVCGISAFENMFALLWQVRFLAD